MNSSLPHFTQWVSFHLRLGIGKEDFVFSLWCVGFTWTQLNFASKWLQSHPLHLLGKLLNIINFATVISFCSQGLNSFSGTVTFGYFYIFVPFLMITTLASWTWEETTMPTLVLCCNLNVKVITFSRTMRTGGCYCSISKYCMALIVAQVAVESEELII